MALRSRPRSTSLAVEIMYVVRLGMAAAVRRRVAHACSRALATTPHPSRHATAARHCQAGSLPGRRLAAAGGEYGNMSLAKAVDKS